jgi:hypothetical protein
MLAGNGTGGAIEFTTDRSVVAGDCSPRFTVEVQYPLSVVIKFLTRIGEQNPTALPLEQRCAKRLFEGLHTLADRRLGHAQCLRSPGEAAQLGCLREGWEMRNLQVFGLKGIHDRCSLIDLSAIGVILPEPALDCPRWL